MALAWALLVASCCWVGYLAAEPYVRRRWPRVLVSWVRVLAGRVRDPLVGRDVLIGCVGGTMLAVLGFGGILVPGWFGFAPELVPADIIGVAYGLQRVTAVLVWRVGQSCHRSCCGVPLALARSFIATPMVGGHRFVVLCSTVVGLSAEYFWIVLVACAFVNALFVLLLLRVGLLAAVVAFYSSGLLIVFPVTADLSQWDYAGGGVIALLTLAALATFGFWTLARGSASPGPGCAGRLRKNKGQDRVSRPFVNQPSRD